MRIVHLLAVTLFAAAIARAEPLLPMAEGTTWQYESTEELGGPAAAAPATASVTVRVGRQTLAGKEFIKLETTTDDVVTKTELMTLDDHGWVCHFRAGKDGRMAKLDPPQTLVPATIKSGDSWDTDGEVAGMEMRQHFVIGNEESVTVAAGRFRAFHIHCEDSSVMSAKLDRWFFPGVGFIKETTVVRGPTGGLLQRTNLELQKRPEIMARAQVTPTPPPPPPTASLTPPIRGAAVETDPAKAAATLWTALDRGEDPTDRETPAPG